jgi:NAD(P)-dependent dehydrogenase (short-subunit alcohol dehydrogenase family)
VSEQLAFAGRRAVVTGGAHGIGAAIARTLTALEAEVVILDVEESERCAPTLNVDLGDADAVAAVAQEAVARLGGVDVLVNCAGITYVAPVQELELERYHRLLAVNLHAPVQLMRLLSPAMVEAGHGRIVNISSVHASMSEPGCLAYDAAKGALEAATRTAAIDLAPHGVLVNAVAPGFVATRLSIVDGVDELESDWFQEVYVRQGQLPLGRAAQPEEVARAVAWLASDLNTYVTGQTLSVDGGLTVRL